MVVDLTGNVFQRLANRYGASFVSRVLAWRRAYIRSFVRIRVVDLILSYRCNLQCDYCDLWKLSEKSDLSWRMISDVLKMLERAPDSIQLSGGEPFLREDLADIYARIKQAAPSSKIAITTNGTLVEVMRKFIRQNTRKGGFSLGISLSGLEHIIAYGENTPRLAALKDFLSFLKRDHQDIPKSLKLVVWDWDRDMIVAIGRFAHLYHCRLQLKFREKAVSYTNPIGTMNDTALFEDPPFMQKYSNSTRQKVALDIGYLLDTMPGDVFNFYDRAYLSELVGYFAGRVKGVYRCACPGNYIMVLPDGKIVPCRYLNLFFSMPLDHRSFSKEIVRRLRQDPGCPLSRSGCLSFWNFFI